MNDKIEAAIEAGVQTATRWHAHDGACADISNETGCTSIRLIEQAIREVAMVTRADMLARDESMETYLLYGCIEKASGEKWTEQEGREFSDRFLVWLKDQGLGYGGLLGEPLEASMSKRGEG